MTARGTRNLNPGNVRKGPDKWQGTVDDQPDPDFVTFKSAEFGIRAIARILLNYKKRGWDTVSQIISHWAPSVENNTDAYVQAVCDSCGFDSGDVLDIDSSSVMLPIIKAIIKHENGEQPYSDAVILEGMRMAGVHDAAPKSIVKQPAAQAVSVATIGGAVAGAGEVARQLREVQDTAQTGIDFIHFLTSYGMGLAIALVVIGGCGALYAMWRKQHRTGG